MTLAPLDFVIGVLRQDSVKIGSGHNLRKSRHALGADDTDRQAGPIGRGRMNRRPADQRIDFVK
jgi:hypothetical protein